jgi:hypothetical protein
MSPTSGNSNISLPYPGVKGVDELASNLSEALGLQHDPDSSRTYASFICTPPDRVGTATYHSLSKIKDFHLSDGSIVFCPDKQSKRSLRCTSNRPHRPTGTLLVLSSEQDKDTITHVGNAELHWDESCGVVGFTKEEGKGGSRAVTGFEFDSGGPPTTMASGLLWFRRRGSDESRVINRIRRPVEYDATNGSDDTGKRSTKRPRTGEPTKSSVSLSFVPNPEKLDASPASYSLANPSRVESLSTLLSSTHRPKWDVSTPAKSRRTDLTAPGPIHSQGESGLPSLDGSERIAATRRSIYPPSLQYTAPSSEVHSHGDTNETPRSWIPRSSTSLCERARPHSVSPPSAGSSIANNQHRTLDDNTSVQDPGRGDPKKVWNFVTGIT